MKPTLEQPAKRVDKNRSDPSVNKRPAWKVLIFFVPLSSGGGLPKPPGNKGWMEIVLLLLKVIAALVALGKAIGWAT
ncbi:hypothetical protein CEQ90_11935 [Lewinellaceae bacterium SD302]|nr:hypothetical protein CEQ90_11935 [Lewinellaceae bacterium SD302]